MRPRRVAGATRSNQSLRGAVAEPTRSPPRTDHMVDIKITGFGYTWVEGDHHPLAIAGVATAIVLINLVLCRTYGYYHPQEPDDDAKED
jgi:hypothetical protein